MSNLFKHLWENILFELFRYRKFVGTNRWNKIESLHQDHTQVVF